MKFLIVTLLALGAFFAQADTSLNDGSKCLKKMKRYYYQNGQKSDIPLTFSFVKVLSKGEPLKGYADSTIAVFEEDKLIYSISGSYYSGWFNDVSVVNTQTCETEEIINIYSE